MKCPSSNSEIGLEANARNEVIFLERRTSQVTAIIQNPKKHLSVAIKHLRTCLTSDFDKTSKTLAGLVNIYPRDSAITARMTIQVFFVNTEISMIFPTHNSSPTGSPNYLPFPSSPFSFASNSPAPSLPNPPPPCPTFHSLFTKNAPTNPPQIYHQIPIPHPLRQRQNPNLPRPIHPQSRLPHDPHHSLEPFRNANRHGQRRPDPTHLEPGKTAGEEFD